MGEAEGKITLVFVRRRALWEASFSGVRAVDVSLWGEGGKGMGETSGLRHSLLKSFSSIISFTLCPGQRQNITWHASLSPSIKLLDSSRIFPSVTWFLNGPLKRLGAFLLLLPSAQGVSHLLPEKLLYWTFKPTQIPHCQRPRPLNPGSVALFSLLTSPPFTSLKQNSPDT